MIDWATATRSKVEKCDTLIFINRKHFESIFNIKTLHVKKYYLIIRTDAKMV